jgi:aminopeptidase N
MSRRFASRKVLSCRSVCAIGLGLIATTACLAVAAYPSTVPAATLGPPVTNETPVNYRIDLTIDPAEPRFTGHAEIDFKLKEHSRLIHLYGRGLNVTHVEVCTGGRVVSATYRQIDSAGHAEVAPAATVQAGSATLVFDYDAAMEEGPSALFHAEVNGQWFAWSELEGTDARRVFPSFDQLNFKTPFTVSLTVPRDLIALSAMPEIEHHRIGDRERHVFAPSPPLPTYLVSFAVGPFVSVTGAVPPNAQRKEPLPLRVFAPRGEAPKLDYTLTQSAAIIGLLEEQFGVPFPYPKIDQIGSSLMKGGMENAGAAVYGDDQLFPGDKGSLRQQRGFGILVSHELAHQWFGDFVTPLWWDDIWLKESFATWAAQTVTPRWQHGDVAAESQFLGLFVDMGMDELPGQKAMRQPVDEAQSKLGYFFSYGKGSQILSMVEAYIGSERFRAGVHSFLTAHANASATAADFFSALGAAAGSPAVTKTMHTFTDQPGVPLLDIRREGETMVVQQSRYAPIGVTVKPQLWTIPFCYRVGADRRCTILDKETTKIELTHSAPVMPNADGKGYYRFNLTNEEWTRLIAEGERMPLAEGMVLDDSLWSAFRSGHVSAASLISALRRLAANPRPEIALDGANRWMQLDDLGFIPQEVLPAYRTLLARTYAPMLAKLGFDPTTGRYDQEEAVRRQLRADLVNVLALGARQADVMASLNQATDRFLAGDEKALDPAFLTVAFKTRVRSGGQAAAEALLAKAVADQDGIIHTMAITALGASDDPGVAAWLIGKLGHTGLRLFDEMDLVQGMLKYAATQDLALNWLRTNYARIAAMHIGRSWGPYLAANVCSAGGAAEIERLMRPTAPIDTSEGFALDRVLETIEACTALRTARSGDIAQALRASH